MIEVGLLKLVYSTEDERESIPLVIHFVKTLKSERYLNSQYPYNLFSMQVTQKSVTRIPIMNTLTIFERLKRRSPRPLPL